MSAPIVDRKITRNKTVSALSQAPLEDQKIRTEDKLLRGIHPYEVGQGMSCFFLNSCTKSLTASLTGPAKITPFFSLAGR